MANFKLYTAADILQYDFKADRDEQIRIEDDCVVFVKHSYKIELNRCRSRAKILQWVHHLSGKVWMTVDFLERFIELTAEYHGINIYGGKRQ